MIVLLSGVVFPLACDTNKNPGPAAPVVGPVPSSTPTGTLTPGTPTNTFTPPPGASTATFTPTSSVTPPVFRYNYSTSAAPRSMALNGSILTVAENTFSSSGIVTEMEEYTIVAAGVLDLGAPPNIFNIVKTGCPPIPTPGSTPVIFTPSTSAFNQVQGFVNPGGNLPNGWSAALDMNPDGSAKLYMGYYSFWFQPLNGVFLDPLFMPFSTTAYGTFAFNNPQGLCADFAGLNGSVYVADTGRGWVEQFSPYELLCPNPPLPRAEWNGSPNVTVGGTGSVFKSAGVTFRQPWAVTCDNTPAGNVWVGDAGYPNSYIMEYTSGATTILQCWQGIAGCKVHGLAVDPVSGFVYVADAGNNLVEVYSSTGDIKCVFGDPGPSANEFSGPFSPSCIAFSGGYIYVGDVTNRYVDVFQ